MAEALPRRFHLQRDTDITGVSGTGRVADGVLWPDGTVSLRWRGDRPSTVHWDRIADAEHVHGHHGATRIVWDDEAVHLGAGANAEDCPACHGTNPPYPFICPGPGEASGATSPRPTVKPSSVRYAEELRRTPGVASADGHAGWECTAGASLIARAETPGPGRLGTHHGAIYTCTEHQAAAEERIACGGYQPQTDPAPAGHRWDPWPCGHVTAYNSRALSALQGADGDQSDGGEALGHVTREPYRAGEEA